MILCSNPLLQYQAQKDEIDAAIDKVLNRGWYILGDETSGFEAEFATFMNVSHAVGVGSGTEALHIALKACDIGPGDEVITVSHTAVATVAAIELTGATPVLVDIEPQFFTLDPALVESAITRKTRAVIPVHLYGQPADVASILNIVNQHELQLIEDCAQSHGSTFAGKRVGTFGNVGCFSFYPTKNLGALGDGGATVTNDVDTAEKIRSLRQYGWSERYVSATPGWNSRLDELQAAILRVKLRKLEADNSIRQELARRYNEGLKDLDVTLPMQREGATHVYHLYVIRHKERDRLLAQLRSSGIAPLIHYPIPIHMQGAYKDRVTTTGPMTQTELAANEVLSLPIYPGLTESEQDRVIDSVRKFFRGTS